MRTLFTATLASGLLGGKAGDWIRMDLLGPRAQCGDGKVPVGGGLCGSLPARGAGMRAGRHNPRGIGEMVGLCLASRI